MPNLGTFATTNLPTRLDEAAGILPRVWLVVGDKLGDNAQAHIIAEALGWPYEVRQVFFLRRYIHGKPGFKPSVHHIDKARSDSLEPPWPDLIITIGRRPSMAALWIHKQSQGNTKLILIGRPKRWIDRFDLVIAPAQYRLPNRPNVLHLDLPLMRSNEAAIATAAEAWQTRFEALPRPLIALLVGGPTEPFALDATVADQLLDLARRTIAETGGTFYITTSRRTPSAVIEALQAGLPTGARLYRWTDGDINNPYLALLGLADRFIVTGDSISMMVEVARLGKPLAIFPLPTRRGSVRRLRQLSARLLDPSTEDGKKGGLLQFLGEVLHRLGLVGYSRDLTAIHQLLIVRGLAVNLGDPFPTTGRRAADELPYVVERIKLLIAGS